MTKEEQDQERQLIDYIRFEVVDRESGEVLSDKEFGYTDHNLSKGILMVESFYKRSSMPTGTVEFHVYTEQGGPVVYSEVYDLLIEDK